VFSLYFDQINASLVRKRYCLQHFEWWCV